MIKGMVSVVIPNFNYAKYLPECIESVINQTYKNWEIIFVDDNSSDNSIEIIKKYIEKYPKLRIRIFNNKKGPSGTPTPINIGIRNMNGEYFAWLSSDDIFHAEKLKKQIELFNQDSSLSMVYNRISVINDNGKFVKKGSFIQTKDRKLFFLSLLKRNFINGNTVLIKKKVFDDLGLFIERLDELPEAWFSSEYEMWLKIALTKKVYGINEVLHYSRKHEENKAYNTSGLGDKLRGFYLHYFFKSYSPLKIKRYLKLSKSDLIYVEAFLRKELEKCGYSEDVVIRSQVGNDKLLENKILNRMSDFSKANYLNECINYYLNKKDIFRVLDYIKKAMILNPLSNFGSKYLLASEEKNAKNLKEAERLFQEILIYDPQVDSPFVTGANFHLGEIYLEKKQLRKALVYFSKCIKENPNHEKGLDNILRFLNKGNPINAI